MQRYNGFLLVFVLNVFSIMAAAEILPGVAISSIWTAVFVSLVLGFVNAFIRPIIFLVTLPINVLTLGLFTFVIIGFITLAVSAVVPGFYIKNFWWALLFSFTLSIINSFLQSLLRSNYR